MIRDFRFRKAWAAMALGVVAGAAEPVWACAVCFGDPDSKMAQGAVAGVLVLVGIVSFVLVGMAGTSLYWMQRSRRLARVAEDPSQSGEHEDRPARGR